MITHKLPSGTVSIAAGDDGFAFQIGRLRVVVSWGMGWEHASVSTTTACPTWEQMCFIKELLWDAEDVVVQYHPAKSQYVNFHPYCLHLWRPTEETMPVPDPIMVGPVGARP